MSQNFFEHFSIEVRFLPNLEEVRKQYLKISKEHHPDFSAGNDQAYEQALIITSHNNQAYKALTDFDERIKYVLELLGDPISTDDKLEPSFLMEMMDWNERIMEVGMEENHTEIEKLSAKFLAIEEEFKGKLIDLIEQYDSTQQREKLASIKVIYLQRKYLLRLRNSIDKFARL